MKGTKTLKDTIELLVTVEHDRLNPPDN
jgi:hypothetical protein